MTAQVTVSAYLRDFDWYGQAGKFRVIYRGRARAALEVLAKSLPNCTWTQLRGDFYTWVRLPPDINTWSMLPRMVQDLVAHVSDSAFYTDGRDTDHLRVAYCYPPEGEIREGTRRLAITAVQEEEFNGAK